MKVKIITADNLTDLEKEVDRLTSFQGYYSASGRWWGIKVTNTLTNFNNKWQCIMTVDRDIFWTRKHFSYIEELEEMYKEVSDAR